MMLSFLKPNKANALGTVLLLVANYAGSFVSRLASGLLIPRGEAASQFAGGGNMTQFAGGGGRAAYAGAGGFGNSGLLSGAINFVVLAVLFYIVISFVMSTFANTSQTVKPEGEAGKAKRKENP